MKKSMFVIAVSLFLFSGLSHAQEYGEGKVIGYGTSPKFVDDTTVAFVNRNSILTLVNLRDQSSKEMGNKPITDFRPTINGFVVWDWKPSRTTIRTVSPTGTVTSEIELSKDSRTGTGFSGPVILPDGTVGYWTISDRGMSYNILQQGNLSVSEACTQWIGDIKPTNPYEPKGDIVLRRVDNSASKVILPGRYTWSRSTFFDGSQQCGFKLLVVGPGGIITVVDTEADSNWQLGDTNSVIAVDTTINGVFYKMLLGQTMGRHASWSPNCMHIVATFQVAGIAEQEELSDIIYSDIQVFSAVDRSLKIQIETPDLFETKPDISSKGDVVCRTSKGEIRLYETGEAK